LRRKFLAKYEHVIEGQRQAVQQRRQPILSGRNPCSSELERLISVATIDEFWAEHLEAVAELRDGSQWVSLGGKDPLHYYLKTVHQMFEEFEQTIDGEILKRVAETRASGLSPIERGATWTYLTTDQPFGSMQERFVRGVIAKIKERRSRKAAYLKAPKSCLRQAGFPALGGLKYLLFPQYFHWKHACSTPCRLHARQECNPNDPEN
jgi:preprotein translocase subunit SecA